MNGQVSLGRGIAAVGIALGVVAVWVDFGPDSYWSFDGSLGGLLLILEILAILALGAAFMTNDRDYDIAYGAIGGIGFGIYLFYPAVLAFDQWDQLDPGSVARALLGPHVHRRVDRDLVERPAGRQAFGRRGRDGVDRARPRRRRTLPELYRRSRELLEHLRQRPFLRGPDADRGCARGGGDRSGLLGSGGRGQRRAARRHHSRRRDRDSRPERLQPLWQSRRRRLARWVSAACSSEWAYCSCGSCRKTCEPSPRSHHRRPQRRSETKRPGAPRAVSPLGLLDLTGRRCALGRPELVRAPSGPCRAR